MNAAEIIQEIIRLPEAEKSKVLAYVCQLGESSAEQTRISEKDGFEKAVESVFSKHSKLFEELAK